VECYSSAGGSEKPAQCTLARKQRTRAQVNTVQLEQIERPEECVPIVLATVQALEIGHA
jgi:hypothetical protein